MKISKEEKEAWLEIADKLDIYNPYICPLITIVGRSNQIRKSMRATIHTLLIFAGVRAGHDTNFLFKSYIDNLICYETQLRLTAARIKVCKHLARYGTMSQKTFYKIQDEAYAT